MHFNLVFEGGGAKGAVFAGAMQEFERQGHTYGRLLGTSAGAITATLLAAGFSAAEMLAQVNEKLPDGSPRFSTFMDVADSIAEADWENSVLFKLFKQCEHPKANPNSKNIERAYYCIISFSRFEWLRIGIKNNR